VSNICRRRIKKKESYCCGHGVVTAGKLQPESCAEESPGRDKKEGVKKALFVQLFWPSDGNQTFHDLCGQGK